jgi:hypothetical protein
MKKIKKRRIVSASSHCMILQYVDTLWKYLGEWGFAYGDITTAYAHMFHAGH